jgi:hypothetical protein
MTDTINPENDPAETRLQRLLHRFALAARAHHEALEALDAERTETYARMLAGLYSTLASTGEEGLRRLLDMVDSSDPVVSGMAAVYSIQLDSGRCLAVLRRIALEPGLIGFRAGAAVERWESGEWENPGDKHS